MRLVLVRHGETALNAAGRIQGQNSDPLSATGRAQADALASALAADLPFVLYSSPVARAAETANAIAQAQALDVSPMRELAEADAGQLDGLSGREMRERFPDFVREWNADSATARMPGGETLEEVQARVWRGVSQLLQRHGDRTVVAVTHNFPIRAIVCKVLGIPLHSFRKLRQDVASISRLDVDPEGGVLVSLNETSHLAALRTQGHRLGQGRS